ncbi:HAMP domain-containing sensor histidine kinase [Mucilaginibacter sp. CAU 1740]|uniref:sensor histidine kinase n=1 Tax=Mucilaginibacter sp. CAU 1740 TaxID=3140365 RepID=UPI00325A4EBA
MKRRLTFLFLIATVTAGGIILFQCYWVFNNYKTGSINLRTQLSDALQKSIDNYNVERSELPLSLKSPNPFVSVLKVIKADSSLHKKIIIQHSKRDLAQIEEIPVNPENVYHLKVMLAESQFISANFMNDVNMQVLNSLYGEELKKAGIDIEFTLLLKKNLSKLPVGKVEAYLNFSRNSPVIEAVFPHISQLLFAKNLVPCIISLILIFFSAGSLCYMWIIIQKQMKLDYIKNDFINNITHELRTPISTLKSTHEALLKYGGISVPEKADRYLKINTDILNKLDCSVDRILDIIIYENGKKVAKKDWVDIDSLIASLIERISPVSNKTVSISGPAGIKKVYTDGYFIDAILSNLIENAVKYGGGNVKINLTIEAIEKGWQVIIQDNGIGIDAQFLPFIFDKFYRVPSGNLHEVKGYGLGLSYVKQLVSLLDGNISVKSKINAGTTFIVQFP